MLGFFNIAHQVFTCYTLSCYTERFMVMANQNWMHSTLSPASQTPTIWAKGKPVLNYQWERTLTYIWSPYCPGNLLKVTRFSPFPIYVQKQIADRSPHASVYSFKSIFNPKHLFGFGFFPSNMCPLANKYHKILSWIFLSTLTWALVTPNSSGLGCWHI